MPWDSGRQIWIPGEQIWLPIFQELAPDFPAPGSSRAQWGHFALSCGSWPGVLLALGAAVVLWVLCQSCMIRPARRSSRRPSPKTTCVLSLLAVAVVAAGAVMCVCTSAGATGRLGADATVAAQLGDDLLSDGWAIGRALGALARDCPAAAQPPVEAYVRSANGSLSAFALQAQRYADTVRPVPDRIGAVKSTTAGFRRLVLLGLLVPLGLMVACVLALAAAARLSRRSWKAGCCMHCLVPAFLAPAALAAAAAAAAQLELGVALGSFCENRDSNMVDYVSYLEGNESTMALLVSFYVSSNASGVNPLLDYQRGAAANATALGDSVDALLREDAGSGNITTLCPRWSGASSMTAAVGRVEHSLSRVEDVLSWGRVHPLYLEAVHDGTCGSDVAALGWLVLVQTLAGLAFFPCVALASGRYARAVAARQEAESARLIPRAHTESTESGAA